MEKPELDSILKRAAARSLFYASDSSITGLLRNNLNNSQESRTNVKIKIENLSKKFPSRDKSGDDVIAVNKLNLEIPDGKLVSVLGPSGCGKSTV